MAINLEDTGHNVYKAAREVGKYVGHMHTAFTEEKWWRLTALIVLAAVMVAAVLLAKPILVGYFTKFFIGTWGLPLPISKVVASCAGRFFTTQLGNVLKYWVLKIDK